MKDRIKQLRKAKGLTQPEFGERLGISRDAVANIEGGRVEPSEVLIRMICKTYHVNEIWMRTGEGQMLEDLSEGEQIAAYVAEVLSDSPESFRRRLLKAQTTWTDEMWDALEKICASLK